MLSHDRPLSDIEDIDRSDLTEAVEAAESERDKLIEKATNLLAEVDRIIDTPPRPQFVSGVRYQHHPSCVKRIHFEMGA